LKNKHHTPAGTRFVFIACDLTKSKQPPHKVYSKRSERDLRKLLNVYETRNKTLVRKFPQAILPSFIQ